MNCFRVIGVLVGFAVFVIVLGGLAYANIQFSAPATVYTVGSDLRCAITSDFNNDGYLDVASVNAYNRVLYVSLNNGDGTFQSPVSYFSGGFDQGDYSEGIFSADLDGDGDKDLIITHSCSYYDIDKISVLENSGDGTFTAPIDYDVRNGPSCVIAADLDGDGDNDLAVSNSLSNRVSILKNDGNGTFQAAVNYLVASCPENIVAADLDKDGDIDLATANFISDNVSILKNNGDGTFQTANSYAALNCPAGLASGDVDNDGDIDLIVAGDTLYENVNLRILKNNGNGTFQTGNGYDVEDYLVSVVASDFDQDGDVDVAVISTSPDKVYILENIGGGAFQSDGNYVVPAAFHITQGDLDKDCAIDLAIVGGSKLSILFNQLSVPCLPLGEPINYSAPSKPVCIFAEDLNKDGYKDLAVSKVSQALPATNGISILKNDKYGVFLQQENYDSLTSKDFPSISGADFNLDGDINLVITDWFNNRVSVYPNNGWGVFGAPSYYSVGSIIQGQ